MDPDKLEISQKSESKKYVLSWGPSGSILVTVAAYLASQLILILPFSVISLMNPNQDVSSYLGSHPWLELSLAGLSAATIIAVIWFFLKKRGSKLSDLGFTRIKISHIGWAVLGMVVYFVLLVVVTSLATKIPGFNVDQPQDVGYSSAAGWQLGVVFVGLVVLPPLAEEMLFRGFLYRGLATKWPRIIAAVLASVLFAVVHLQWNVGLDVFVLSMVMIAVLEKTKNLWTCVFMHAIKNGLAFLVLFVFVSH